MPEKFTSKNQLKKFWNDNNSKIAFSLLLMYFFSFAIFIAFNFDIDIINDEIRHFNFSKQFSTTLGIPPELPEAYRYGVYITQNPFLFYWINGRVINIASFFSPNLDDWQLLVTLRIVNSFYALGTIIFCYLLSKEFISHKWWQLLPPFFLSNTIMFVFLAGGVNYDNLTNLFCMAGLYFLARIFNNHDFLINSLAWMICISLGSLTKFTVLPLALYMGIIWLFFLFANRKQIFPIQIIKKKVIPLGFILLLLILGNMAIYGHNLLVYQSLQPKCEDLLTEEECKLDFYNLRNEKFGMEGKFTILESIRLGYPNPAAYFVYWVSRIIGNIFGIGSYKSYQNLYRIGTHWILLWWVFTIAIINKIHLNFKNLSFMVILIFYFFTVFIFNYNNELSSGFAHFAIHGRYLFPVIGILDIALTKGIMKIPHKIVQKITLIFALLLYFFTGPLTFIYRYNAVFSDWFVR